jgi:hypothetical protein
MPETQIRRLDGSNTTIPELLQELAAKEAVEANPNSVENSGEPPPGVNGMTDKAALRRIELPQR